MGQTNPCCSLSFEEFVEQTCSKGLDFEPGSSWRYSNTGYMLFHRLIEVLTNQDYDRVMADEIFIPLGLRNTFVIATAEGLRPLVCGHSRYLSKGDPVVDVRTLYHPCWVATGVIVSTAEEIAHFYHELLSGRVLRIDLLDEMINLVPVRDSHPFFKKPSYGLGLMADPASKYGALYGHTGEGPGYCAAAYHVRRDRGQLLTISVLCNSEGADRAERIMFGLISALDGVLKE